MLSRQISKSSTESQDLAREREVLLDKLRAAEQVPQLALLPTLSCYCVQLCAQPRGMSSHSCRAT